MRNTSIYLGSIAICFWIYHMFYLFVFWFHILILSSLHYFNVSHDVSSVRDWFRDNIRHGWSRVCMSSMHYNKPRLTMNMYCFGRNFITASPSLSPVQLPAQKYENVEYLTILYVICFAKKALIYVVCYLNMYTVFNLDKHAANVVDAISVSK